ncbi:hypothetical protein HanIR_Chr09g0449431 [Helianthus annuus]|nr:hypothetical protein HanIR_Chr09g0449431 [Helianthus annuus]
MKAIKCFIQFKITAWKMRIFKPWRLTHVNFLLDFPVQKRTFDIYLKDLEVSIRGIRQEYSDCLQLCDWSKDLFVVNPFFLSKTLHHQSSLVLYNHPTIIHLVSKDPFSTDRELSFR